MNLKAIITATAHKVPEKIMTNFPAFKEIFIQMLPPTLSFQMIIIGVLIMQIALKEFGPQAIAGHSVAMRVEQLVLLPILGMTHALLPIVAQNFGAKKFDRVREALALCLKIGIVSMCLCYPLIWFFSGSILKIFTNDQEVICLLYTSPSPRDRQKSRMPSSA